MVTDAEDKKTRPNQIKNTTPKREKLPFIWVEILYCAFKKFGMRYKKIVFPHFNPNGNQNSRKIENLTYLIRIRIKLITQQLNVS